MLFKYPKLSKIRFLYSARNISGANLLLKTFLTKREELIYSSEIPLINKFSVCFRSDINVVR